MATSSRTRSNGPVLPRSNAFQRSTAPTASSTSSAFGYSTFASSRSSSYSSFRSSSPTRVNLIGSSPSSSPSVRFSIDRPTSPGRSFSVVSQRQPVVKKPVTAGAAGSGRRTCMCSPTNHPGSFRCSLHKGFSSSNHAVYSSSNRLNARRSAMTNSLVRIGTVEGDLVKRALAALIRPSSHQQRRRAAFQPRPSRLSVMSKADDL